MENGEVQNIPTGFEKEMAEILETFLVESNEILDTLGQDLLEIEKRPTDIELLNAIFRASHTLKGTASFLGFTQMTDFSHRMEDLLNKLRKGERSVTREIIDVMFQAYDVVKALLARIESRNVEPMDLSVVLAKLDACIQGTSTQSAKNTSAPAPQAASAEDAQNQFSQQKSGESTIRVDVTRLDNLMNLVGELVLARNRLTQTAQSFTGEHNAAMMARELQETSAAIDFATTELQMAVMKTRMVPVAKVFDKLPRLVRELSKETNKNVDLQIYGKDTELDKSIIDELYDPLVHIIRNAIDHGIETSEVRKAARKPEKGAIVVNAEHEGNHIIISVEDDGRGMDHEVLKAKAIEKGILTFAEAAEMSRREILNLIFVPGFTTAESVTSISGRGVGMDVVRTNVTKLKGIIEIDSEVGRGTMITLKLPLTLAIIQGLIVESAGEFFALPLGSVLEVVRVQKEEIDTINGLEVIKMRDLVLPLGRISDLMHLEEKGDTSSSKYIVVVGWSEQRLGIIVDSLHGQREIVIKSLGDYLGDVPAIAGSTILGDGKIILIIDVGEFIQLCGKRNLDLTKGTHTSLGPQVAA